MWGGGGGGGPPPSGRRQLLHPVSGTTPPPSPTTRTLATVIHYNIGSRPTVLSFPSAQNFIIVQCFAIALSGTPPILYMFELSICVVIALAIKSHHGGSPSSTPEEHRVYTCLHGL